VVPIVIGAAVPRSAVLESAVVENAGNLVPTVGATMSIEEKEPKKEDRSA